MKTKIWVGVLFYSFMGCANKAPKSNLTSKLDSINTDLTKEIGKIPMYSLVYPYKKAVDGTHILVGCSPVIDAVSV